MWQVAQLLTPRVCALASHHSPPTPEERARVYSLYYDKFNRDQSRLIAYLRECAIGSRRRPTPNTSASSLSPRRNYHSEVTGRR